VRGGPAPGSASHGALRDEQRGVSVAGGAVVRRVQPPAREHPGRHLRVGAPGLRLSDRRARAVGVQHHPSGLQGRAASRGGQGEAPLGQQRLRHGALRYPRARRGGRTRRRGGRRLQAHDGRDVPDLQPSAPGIHHSRQGKNFYCAKLQAFLYHQWRIETDTDSCAKLQGRRNSICLQRRGFKELYVFSPGSKYQWYGKYAFVVAGPAMLEPVVLRPGDKWQGGQYLRNPNL
jgi:hypothetical protein